MTKTVAKSSVRTFLDAKANYKNRGQNFWVRERKQNQMTKTVDNL